jgi:FkbM family methyltransferase
VRAFARDGLHRALRRFGVDLVRYTPDRFPDLRRSEAIRTRAIDLVLDIGANAGGWALRVRRAGYDGRIVSFEPLASAYAQLREASAGDPLWDIRQVALSDSDGRASINVAANSWSSSLLPMASLHTEAAPESAYVGEHETRTARLDSLMGDVYDSNDRILVKVDVQGLELPVLRGAGEMLSQVQALEAELSYSVLYSGQALLPEVVTFLANEGFALVAIEPVLVEPRTGRLLQADGFFLRDGN